MSKITYPEKLFIKPGYDDEQINIIKKALLKEGIGNKLIITYDKNEIKEGSFFIFLDDTSFAMTVVIARVIGVDEDKKLSLEHLKKVEMK